MSKLIIADTSCLIALERINRLALLEILFEKITITPEIRREFGINLHRLSVSLRPMQISMLKLKSQRDAKTRQKFENCKKLFGSLSPDRFLDC